MFEKVIKVDTQFGCPTCRLSHHSGFGIFCYINPANEFRDDDIFA